MTEGLKVKMYEEAPRAKFVPTRPYTASQAQAGDMTLEEFRQALIDYKDKGDIPAEAKESFNRLLENQCFTYLNGSNREVSDLFRNYLTNECVKKQGTELEQLIGDGASGFHGHITRNHKNTTASLLLEFIDSVRVEGKDKVKLSPELATKLYDANNGFGITSSAIQTVRGSSDPLVRATLDIAMKLGLGAVVTKTRSDVLNGINTERTRALSPQVINGILEARNTKNKAMLPSDGSMVIGYDKAGKALRAYGFAVDDIITGSKGPKERSPFKDQAGTQIKYNEFFEQLTEMQLKNDKSDDRNAHVINFLTAVFERYDQRIAAAESPANKAEIYREEQAVAKNLTGRGLLSAEMCAPVIAALAEHGKSAAAIERLTATKLDTLAVTLIEDFKYEMTNSDTAKTFDYVGNIWKDDKMEIINPDTFRIEQKGLNGRTKDADMTSAQKNDNSKVTVEKAYDLYRQARKTTIDKAFDGLIAKKILGSNYVSSAKINKSLRSFGDNLSAEKTKSTSENTVTAFIKAQLNLLISDTANKDDAKEISKGLDKFIATVTGNEVSSLDSQVYKHNEVVKQARDGLASAVARGSAEASINAAVDTLLTAIKDRKAANGEEATAASKASNLSQLMDKVDPKDKTGQNTLSALFEGFRATAPSEEGLTKVLDLEQLHSFINSNSKLKGLIVDESNKRSFAEIEAMPAEAGSLVSLIFKKEDTNANNKDHAANLVGLLGVISKVSDIDTREKLLTSLVDTLYKPKTDVPDEQNNRERATITRTLISIANGDAGYILDTKREASGTNITADDPAFYLNSSALKLLKSNLVTAFLPSYDKSKRQELGTLLDAHIRALDAATVTHQGEIETAKTNIRTTLTNTLTTELGKLDPILKDAKDAVTKVDGNFAEVSTELTQVKSGVDLARTAIEAAQTALSTTSTEVADIRAAVVAAQVQLTEARGVIPAELFNQIDAALAKTTPDTKAASEALAALGTELTKASEAITKSHETIEAEITTLTSKLAVTTEPALVTALQEAQEHLNGKGEEYSFSAWVDEKVTAATERERFLGKSYELMAERENQVKGWYSSGFIALYAPAAEAQASREDNVETLKRMEEHSKAEDPRKSFLDHMGKQTDAESTRLLKIYNGMEDTWRNVHQGPNVTAMHGKTIFERMVQFIQSFIMNKDLQGISTEQYYPKYIRDRMQAGNDGASLASSRPAASPAKPEAAPSLN